MRCKLPNTHTRKIGLLGRSGSFEQTTRRPPSNSDDEHRVADCRGLGSVQLHLDEGGQQTGDFLQDNRSFAKSCTDQGMDIFVPVICNSLRFQVIERGKPEILLEEGESMELKANVLIYPLDGTGYSSKWIRVGEASLFQLL